MYSGQQNLVPNFVRRAGYTPITTCSPSNFDFVKSLGAAGVFDYGNPDVVGEIKAYTNNLRYVWDTISLSASMKICTEVIAPNGSYGSIIRVQVPRGDLRYTFSLGYTAIGEPVTKGPNVFPDNTEDFEFCKAWIQEVEGLLQEGRLRVHPIRVERGLENVLDGIDLLRRNRVSGKKLVYLV